MKKMVLQLVCFAIFSGAVAQATAQTPAPIRLVVPYATGNAIDLLARVLAKSFSEQTNVPYVVENRPGNTGHVGTYQVSKMAPDGKNILVLGSSTVVISPHLLKNLPYDPMKALRPIGIAAAIPSVLVVNPSLPVYSLQDLLNYGKSNQGKLTFASNGVGSNLHLMGAQLNMYSGINAVHIPYNAPQLIPDLLGGRIEFTFENIINVKQFIKEGKLRLLAMADDSKLPDFVGVESITRTYPRFIAKGWIALYVASGTPDSIVERLNAELNKALVSTEVRTLFSSQDLISVGGPPSAATERAIKDSADWGRVVDETGTKIDGQ